MPGNRKTKEPARAAGGGTAGEFKGDYIHSVATALDGGKPCFKWPRSDHPFFDQLCRDRNYVWSRMMASVRTADSFENNHVE